MQLSKNFHIDEFYVSEQYPELVPGIPRTEDDKFKMFLIANTLLQPVRDLYGPLRILSGKRSAALNSKVLGSPTSDHLYLGYTGAVDFTPNDPRALYDVYHWLVKNRPNCFGQLILYKNSHFLHISLPSYKHINVSWQWDK